MTNTDTILGRSTTIAIGALSSRVTGFVRTAAIGAAIGAGLFGDAYATATMLPGIIYEILLGGVGTAILVPLINKARSRGTEQSTVFAQRILSVAVLGFAIAAILATAAAPLLIPVLGGRSDNTKLTIALAMFTVPAVFFYGIGAVATAILNSRGRFALPAWAPALYNLTLIAAAAALLLMPTPHGAFGATRTVILGGATLAGAAIQTIVLIPAMRRAGIAWRWRPQLRGLGLRSLSRTLAWVTVYIVFGQSAVLVVIALTRASADHGGPGPFIYNNAWILLMMAYGLLALPVITALTPALSDTTGPEATAATANTYSTGIRLILHTGVPATAAMIVLADPIAIVLFQWGNYTHQQALATGTVIAAAATSLIPYALTQLQLFAFLAVGDAKTPALITIAATCARIAIAVAAYTLIPAEWTAAAMMATGTIAYAITAASTSPRLRTRIGRPPRTNIRTISTILAAGATAGAAAWGVATVIHALVSDTKTSALLALALGLPILAVVYLGISHLTGQREITNTITRRISALRSPTTGS